MRIKRFLTLLLVVMTLMLSAACSKHEITKSQYAIDFGEVASDHWNISDVKMEYKADELSKKISGKEMFIYVSSKVKNYESIAEKYSFSEAQIDSFEDRLVYYKDEMEDYSRILMIWSNGKTSYSTGIKETYFETKVSEADCIELAKEALKQYGLTEKPFDDECYVSTSSVTDPVKNETKIIGYTITVHFLLNGAKLFGSPRAYIQFNGNGEVVTIMYNMPDFIESEPAKLLGVKRVLKLIEKGEMPVMCGLDTDDAPDKITIEDVDICYYSQTYDDGMQIAQPIYVFSAIGHFDNEEIPFTIMAQAN
ncbi:MAG: hypothetical protein J5921_01585 [Clostridia bacterium]|nr:hypothetical protein [Clostridia bacterium]